MRNPIFPEWVVDYQSWLAQQSTSIVWAGKNASADRLFGPVFFLPVPVYKRKTWVF